MPADEAARVSFAIDQLSMNGALFRRGSTKKTWAAGALALYASLLMNCTIHTGNTGVAICPTACVFFGRDGRLNMAFNPYYLDNFQPVDFMILRSPQDHQKVKDLMVVNRVPWVVKPDFSQAPSFVRAAIHRQELTKRLRSAVLADPIAMQKAADNYLDINELSADSLMGLLRYWPKQIQSAWSVPPESLGIDTTSPIAFLVDNSRLVALLVHELLHVAHLHLLVDRKSFADPRTLNLAMDIAIDQEIEGVSDNQWLHWKNVFETIGEPELAPDQHFDYYYQRLIDLYHKYDAGAISPNGKKVRISGGPRVSPSAPPAPTSGGQP